jgi:hypothetical protein
MSKIKINIKFLLASLKTLTNSKDRSKFCFGLPYLMVYFSLFPPSEQFVGPHAAFGTTFKVTAHNRKAFTSFLKRNTGRSK